MQPIDIHARDIHVRFSIYDPICYQATDPSAYVCVYVKFTSINNKHGIKRTIVPAQIVRTR